MNAHAGPGHGSESELLARCRGGDRAARHELYRQTSPRIYGLLLRMTRDADRAADLLQETYLRAFTRIGQFSGHSTLTTWLYRIAVNEALQDSRRAATIRAGLEKRPTAMSSDSCDTRAVERLDVEAALEKLSEEERVLLLLRYHEGLDYRTLAQVTDLPEGTVASRLNRAREKMRQLLAQGYEQREETPPFAHLNPCSGAADAAGSCGQPQGRASGATSP